MVSKKRRTASTTSPRKTKKPKEETATPTSPKSSIPRLKHRRLHPQAATLYAENAKSPLLRLPREIRDQIWSLAYGNHVLHPGNGGPGAYRLRHPMQFWICEAPYTPQKIYDFSLKVLDEDPEVVTGNSVAFGPKTPLQHYHFCAYVGSYRYCTGSKTALKVPIVCRQMWDEMSETVYETCTFGFANQSYLMDFLSCKKAGLKRVRHILLAPVEMRWWNQSWDLKWWVLKSLKNLQSLDFWVGWDPREVGGKIDDESWYWKKNEELSAQKWHLQRILQELRWTLAPEKIRIVVHNGEERKLPGAEHLKLAKQIHSILMGKKKKR